MSSDWQYINDHMGGHDEDGLPNFMNEPGFFADTDEEWLEEHNDYYGKDFKTIEELEEWLHSEGL